MASVQVEENSAHAQAIQNAVQSRLLEIGWAPEENDTTLSDYITMMLISGKDQQSVQSELAGDLLGMSEDDPMVPEFTKWLFETAVALGPAAQDESMVPDTQVEQAPQDSQMEMDDVTATVGDAVPSGPKAMRNGTGSGTRGRDKRMLGQMNRQLDRSQDVPDSLRRIKGAAGGAGRINSHAGAPRGPRHQAPGSGLQRMMNGRPGQPPMNPMMQPNAMMNNLDPQNQMMMMQMMEMQAQLMQQMVQNGGMPNSGPSHRGRGGKSMFDRMDKRGQNKIRAAKEQNGAAGEGESGMEVDESAEKKAPFDTICYWNANCTNVNCIYAHQSPAAPPGTAVDMNDTCKFGAKCTNFKCAGRHPSPAILHSQQKAAQFGQFKQKTPCRFAPNCTRPDCPFEHAGAGTQNSSAPPCRYPVCKNPNCTFSHTEGQKAMFKDKVWTANGADGSAGIDASKSDRFSELKANEGEPEELIKPDQGDGQTIQNMDTEIPA